MRLLFILSAVLALQSGAISADPLTRSNFGVVAAPSVPCFPPGECVCSDGCKCSDKEKCPGGCPTKATSELSYAAAVKAVTAGETLTVFVGVKATPVAGKWSRVESLPNLRPGVYRAYKAPAGPVMQFVSGPGVAAPRPFSTPTTPAIGVVGTNSSSNGFFPPGITYTLATPAVFRGFTEPCVGGR